MSKRSLYKHLDTGEEIELTTFGEYYVNNDGKVFYKKEIKCMYRFLGYVHDRVLLERNYKAERNINGFLIRSYKRKSDDIKQA